MEDDMMQDDVKPENVPLPTISELAHRIQRNFSTLATSISRQTLEGDTGMGRKGAEIHELHDRFWQWAGNLGALRPPDDRLSLDYRLRSAENVQSTIFNSLSDLQEAIGMVNGILDNTRPNRRGSGLLGPDPASTSILLEEYGISLSSSSSESDDSGSSSRPSSVDGRTLFGATYELDEWMSAIRGGINSLFREAIFVRRFSKDDRRERARRTKLFDNSSDTLHVLARYPSIDGTFARRLGEANARRRQYFKYCKEHQARLHDQSGLIKPSLQAVKPEIPQSHPAQVPDHPNEFYNSSSLPASTIRDPSTVPAETTVTEFLAEHDSLVIERAESVASTFSVATTIVTCDDDTRSQFPPVPIEARAGVDFVCPLCHVVLKGLDPRLPEKQDYKWRKHILHDMEPYICTFSSCGLETYKTQHDWFSHELLIHRNDWICNQCKDIFEDLDRFRQHVLRCQLQIPSGTLDHGTSSELKMMVSAIVEDSKRSPKYIAAHDCPFCMDDSWASEDVPSMAGGLSEPLDPSRTLVVETDKFKKHVGRHMQTIALFSLPRALLFCGDDDDSERGSHTTKDLLGDLGPSFHWGRVDCGRGWLIVSQKRATFLAFACFVKLFRDSSKHTPTFWLDICVLN
ncbi:hypothetical protein BJ508DRAFT_304382 [Ascobolus immersus RN42]|uniref:C2H2-type domain-containing protein n=1 Tax=Ascobolus immersus RN42 TaxID=1160509 RepID=A0A3N4IEH1_ASCIM|nr:hypothetical protein BJ508DRAFT_304382 [Ascobolus immersus RN42]